MSKRKKLRFNKKETIKLHRQMWLWLAAHPDKNKGDYLCLVERQKIGEGILFECFLCGYAADKKYTTKAKEHMCNFCPVDWKVSPRSGAYFCETSYYALWRTLSIAPTDSTHRQRYILRQRKILATKIANLEERRLYVVSAKHPKEKEK